METYKFLSGGGEMGELIRAKDWSSTPVGLPESWPQSLRTTLFITLNSKFPMFLWWGPQLICFYNDAYRPSLGKNGKHPSILGMKAQDAWAEIWDIIKPLIDQVFTGESTWSEDQLIPIYRNGKIEDVYWTFSYSPVNDESGNVSGVLVTCSETTEKVNTLKSLEESEEKLNIVIDASELGTWELNLKTDEVSYSPRYLEIFGYNNNDTLSHSHFFHQVHPEDLVTRNKAFTEALSNSVLHYESRLIWDDKSIHWIDVKGKVFYDADNQPIKLIGTVRDITDQKSYQEELKENEQRFRLLADSMPQHIWTADPTGNFNYFNKSVFDYSGLSPEEIKKNGWLRIVHPDDREQNISAWLTAIKNGKDFLFEHRFRRYDGVYRWQLSRAVPQKDVQGNIQMWVGTSTDIQQIKELDQQKDFFISMASHELKTPITSIKGYVQLLQVMYLKSEDTFLNNSLKIIDKQISTLTSLISDLLDLSKIKSGGLLLKKEHFQINELIQDVVDEIGHINPAFNISFSKNIDTVIHADRERISQVLINFLTNAVKYSPNSTEIKIYSIVKDNNVVISVEDAGIGISKIDQEKIFERFYRVEGKNEKTFPGFGIGLFICSEIINRHEGNIGVESAPGKGSVFYFSLPFNQQ